MKYFDITMVGSITIFIFFTLASSNEKQMTQQQKLTIFLNSLVENSNTPGVQYIFISANSILYQYSHGMADINDNISMNDSTTFNAYSVTKTFTALAILQLAQQGKLELSDSISKYVDFYPYSQSPTIQRTLSHTAGFTSPIPIKWIHLQEEHGRFNEAEFIQKVLRENSDLAHEPGKKFSYSNIGYLLLGKVIEKVSGQSYQEYIRSNILEKLDLDCGNGAKLDFDISSIESHARGYIKRWSLMNFVLGFMIDKNRFTEKDGGKWIQFKNIHVNGSAYGGLIGNAAGLAKYLQALLKNSILISDEYESRLFTRQKTNDGKETGMCLSWFAGDLSGEQYFAHAGGGGGYYCEIRIYSGKNRASVIMFNRTGVRDEWFLDKVDKFLLYGLCKSKR